MKHLEITMKVILQIIRQSWPLAAGRDLASAAPSLHGCLVAVQWIRQGKRLDQFAYESVLLGVNPRYFPKIST